LNRRNAPDRAGGATHETGWRAAIKSKAAGFGDGPVTPFKKTVETSGTFTGVHDVDDVSM
jgi:hypothetical protein